MRFVQGLWRRCASANRTLTTESSFLCGNGCSSFLNMIKIRETCLYVDRMDIVFLVFLFFSKGVSFYRLLQRVGIESSFRILSFPGIKKIKELLKWNYP